MLDEYSLTKAQIAWLIQVKKYAVNPNDLVSFTAKLREPLSEDIMTADFIITSGSTKLPNYVLHFYLRSLRHKEVCYTMFLRFKKSNLPLIRLDVDGFHKNPSGEIIRGRGHIHLYNPGQRKPDASAYAADINEFPNVDDVADTWMRFLKHINLKEES